MPRYISRPVEIEAIEWDGSEAATRQIIAEYSIPERPITYHESLDDSRPPWLNVATLEGTMTASVGDYIIRGTEGECYPCRPSVFERKYQPV